ncbi:MAG TPA: ABC transporter ATP-binding protein, partial [Pilimelia sp.]|nr:ABC transporter ATP-binding protein [Pilimelia sp.]
MRRALAFGSRALRRRTVLALLAWSVPEMLAAALSGAAVARAVDAGFLAGRPGTGLAWLAVLAVAAGGAALGTRQVYHRLGGAVEPFRDELVRRVVDAALARGVRGGRDDGAVARLTHQVEIARDTFAGLVMVLREFLATSVGAAVGVFSLAPAVAAVILPGFVLGVA